MDWGEDIPNMSHSGPSEYFRQENTWQLFCKRKKKDPLVFPSHSYTWHFSLWLRSFSPPTACPATSQQECCSETVCFKFKASVSYKQGKCIEFHVSFGKSGFVCFNELQNFLQQKHLFVCLLLKLVVYSSNAKCNEVSQKYEPMNSLQHVGLFPLWN